MSKPHYTVTFCAVTAAMLLGGAINRRLAGRYACRQMLNVALNVNAVLSVAMIGTAGLVPPELEWPLLGRALGAWC